MSNVLEDLLLVKSIDLAGLVEDYRQFFLAILPSVFILAVLIEYFDRLQPFTLVKRAVISIIVLSSITSFYESSINASIKAANEILVRQKQGNLLLKDMFGGIEHWSSLNRSRKNEGFFEGQGSIDGALQFLKFHLFDSFINDGFTLTIFFISKLCFLILKVVYSLVYYLGFGLVGIPCLIFLFPSMGNVLRGSVLSFLWCLTLPHVLVFIVSLIGSEINKGYVSGQIIGGSVVGTGFLFILALFIAFTPLITAMVLNGSGVSQAGGVIATIGANYVMNIPRNVVNSGATILTGGSLGPKLSLASKAAGKSYSVAKGVKNVFASSQNGPNQVNGNHSTDRFKKSNSQKQSSVLESPKEATKTFTSASHKLEKNSSAKHSYPGGKVSGKVSEYRSSNSRDKASSHTHRISKHAASFRSTSVRDLPPKAKKTNKYETARSLLSRNENNVRKQPKRNPL